MGTTTVSPLLPLDIGLGLQALQYVPSHPRRKQLADIAQMDSRRDHRLERCLLPLRERRLPCHQVAQTEPATAAALVITHARTSIFIPRDLL